MEVILRENIPTLGQIGDVVRVRDGYARNFLFPQGKAVSATSGNLKTLELQKKSVESKKATLKKEAEDLALKLAALTVTIAKEVGEKEKLFGSVTAQDIADFLRTAGFSIDRRMIRLKGVIKELGSTEIQIHLHPEVDATVKVDITKK